MGTIRFSGLAGQVQAASGVRKWRPCCGWCGCLCMMGNVVLTKLEKCMCRCTYVALLVARRAVVRGHRNERFLDSSKYEWTRAPHPASPSAAALPMQQPLFSTSLSRNNRESTCKARGNRGGVSGSMLRSGEQQGPMQQ
eukprot:1150771-Pelagomonas_calceolata.AAC.2